jgi:hypothetical protein
VVPRGVHVYGGDPLASTHELFDHPLLYQVVHLHCCLGSHEEEGSRRVERDALYCAWCPRERTLCLAFRQLRDKVGGRGEEREIRQGVWNGVRGEIGE